MDPEPDLSIYSSETIEIEIHGERYRGIRFITGTNEIRQEIHFLDLREIDPKPHRPNDVARMRRMARVILRHLVEQWKELEARRPVKVEPHGSRQHRRRN